MSRRTAILTGLAALAAALLPGWKPAQSKPPEIIVTPEDLALLAALRGVAHPIPGGGVRFGGPDKL